MRSPWQTIPSIIAGLVLVTSLLGVSVLGYLYVTTRRTTVEVPEVVGMMQEEAASLAEEFELVLVPNNRKFDADTPEGTILHQNPEPGQVVKVGRPLHVTLSLGKKQLEVPYIDGLTESEAIQVIGEEDLRLGELIEITHPVIGKGRIIAVEPPTGTRVREGDKLNLLVSTGPDARMAMPDIIGMNLADGLEMLRIAGIALDDIIQEPRTELPHNTILNQQPGPGALVEDASKAVLTVSITKAEQRNPSAPRFEVISYTVPDLLKQAKLRIALMTSAGEKEILAGTYPGGKLLKFPVIVEPASTLYVYLNDSAVWKKSF